MRITAHTEGKLVSAGSLPLPRQPLLDLKFQKIFDAAISLRARSIERVDESAQTGTLDTASVVQVGSGVFATDTIGPSTSSNVEEETHDCLNKLICLSYLYMYSDDSLARTS